MSDSRLTEEFSSFVEEMDSIQEFVGAVRNFTNAHLQTALASASLLAVSQLEGLLKGCLRVYAEAINVSNIGMRSLPDSLRDLHTYSRLEEVIRVSASDRPQRMRSLREMFNVYWDDERSVPNPRRSSYSAVSVKILQRQLTSAKPDVIGDVFLLMGCTASFLDRRIPARSNRPSLIPQGVVASRNGTSSSEENPDWEFSLRQFGVRDKLDELVDRRNKIAHGNISAVQLTDATVLEDLCFLVDASYLIMDELSAKMGALRV